MCINPEGEFFAPFDIDVVKVLGPSRRSEWPPEMRAAADRTRTFGSANSRSRGSFLVYPINACVESPSGLGIHCWYNSGDRKRIAKEYRLNYEPTQRHVVFATIPCGALVRWERQDNGELILVTSELIVIS